MNGLPDGSTDGADQGTEPGNATDIVQVKRLQTPADLRARVAALGVELPVDDAVDADGPLAGPLTIVDGSAGELTVGNRWTILPMEGWDASTEGLPTELVHRRWRRFGESGAKLIWGGEAVAVEPSARANPRQLAIIDGAGAALAELRTSARRCPRRRPRPHR